ncbi:DUF7173 family protein [Spartinivicinus marinus]|uniref:DUF7173 family protein n=1 Tax=Spartinivicinus marinus TaxID=2994442 RepID=UPI0022592FC5|nr:hypothetical protein [Spartinivicinus marinus]MCX4025199.1 hypothetical protein [Spartinivicinus marinus]
MHAIQQPQPVNMIDELANQWEFAKQQETEAIKSRRAIEDKLIELVGRKPEGTCSKSTHYFKLKTNAKVNRKVDVNKLADVAQSINPTLFNNLFRVKYEVNTTAFKELMITDSRTYNVAAHAVISTPARTSVSVERLEQ